MRRPVIVSTEPGVAKSGFANTAVVMRRLLRQATESVLLAGFRVTDRALLENLGGKAQDFRVRLFVDLHPQVDPNGRTVRGRRPDLDGYPGWWWRKFLDEVWPEDVPTPEGWYSPLSLQPDSEGAWRSMHVKALVVDESRVLVTSSNFTNRGQERNFELGLLIPDGACARDVTHHFESMSGTGLFKRFPQAAIP